MTEDEMKTKACHKSVRGETSGSADGLSTTFFPRPANCIGSYCIAFRANGSACYCADLKRDN